MKNFKTIEELLKYWKVAIEVSIAINDDGSECASPVLYGIKAAQAVYNEPSNTQMQMDAHCCKDSKCNFQIKGECTYGSVCGNPHH